MSVKVNLLPQNVKGRGAARRGSVLLVLAVLGFVALLGVFFFLKQSSVNQAIAERDGAQMEVNDLQAQVDSLAAFQQLAQELADGNQLLITTMGDEIGVARLLNDVALSLPSTSSLTSLTIDRNQSDPTAGQIQLGDTVANLLLSGYSIERYAPGVEGVLLQFDQINGLIITYLNTAAVADIASVEVTSFDASALLTAEIYTERYLDGLPAVEQ